jgi:hypothetical protein
MATDTAIDKICLDAQSFQHQVDIAKSVDPVFANALLGNAIGAGKTSFGSLLVGGIALISARYGFNWTPDTAEIVAGILVLISHYCIHGYQIWQYRKTLPLTTPVVIVAPVPKPTAAPVVVQTPIPTVAPTPVPTDAPATTSTPTPTEAPVVVTPAVTPPQA